MTTAPCFSFFFFNDTATTEIYTLSLHDALPISRDCRGVCRVHLRGLSAAPGTGWPVPAWPLARRPAGTRSEEHTSELQSQSNLVCRLLLEKKKKAPFYRLDPRRTHTARSDAECR